MAQAQAADLSYLVLLRPGQAVAAVKPTLTAAGGQITRTIPQVGALVVRSSSPDFMSKMSKSAAVESVGPDLRINWLKPTLFHSAKTAEAGGQYAKAEDFGALQWSLGAISAPEAWSTGAEGQGVTVAVLDTGFACDHPDLHPNFLPGQSFVPNEPVQFQYNLDTGAEFSHGTHVAGIIAATDDGQGVTGVAPQAKILPIKVMSDVGSGDFDWLVSGIVYAADHGAKVINMSLGGYIPRYAFTWDSGTPDDPTDDVKVSANGANLYINFINRATTYAHSQGCVLVAAAGNDSLNRDGDPELVNLPADAAFVLQVSATGPIGWSSNPAANLDAPAVYTNYGQSAIDFAAPGGNVDLAFPDGWWFDLVFSTVNPEIGGWAWAGGTSMAAPHAAGVAALIIGKYGPAISPTAVERIMRQSATDLGKPGVDDYYGSGRLNAANAVK
jgi:subtilisin family serine protease